MTYAATTFYVALAAGAVSAYAGYTQQQTQKKIASHNADVADVEAADALKRGEQSKIDARKRGSMIEGEQRAALSSRGLDLSEGTANDILGQTDFFTQSDIATAGTNANKEAWAKESQSTNFQLQEDGINPGLTLAGSLLSTGSNVSGKWYNYGGGKG